MRKSAKPITGVNTASIVGLKALLAQEKTLQSSAPLASRIRQKTEESNKGVTERAQKDLEPENVTPTPKKVVYIGGVAYHQGESDKAELVDIDRKRWEEYERSTLADSRRDFGSVQARHNSFFAERKREEEEEEKRRGERREIITDLAHETAQGKSDAQAAHAKRSRDKLARMELIRQKAQRQQQLSSKPLDSVAQNTPSPDPVPNDPKDDTSWIFGDDEDSEDDLDAREPDTKKRKLLD